MTIEEVKKSKNLYEDVIILLKDIAKKYPYSDKIYSKADIDFLNDLLTLRFLDSNFDKEMEGVIKLDLNITSLEELKIYTNKFNILLLQFAKNPLKLAQVISDLHLYLTLLQEEPRLRNEPESISNIIDSIESF